MFSFMEEEDQEYTIFLHPNLTKSYAQLRKLIKLLYLILTNVDKVIEQRLAGNEDYNVLSKPWQKKWDKRTYIVIDPLEDAKKKREKESTEEHEQMEVWITS